MDLSIFSIDPLKKGKILKGIMMFGNNKKIYIKKGKFYSINNSSSYLNYNYIHFCSFVI